MELQQTEVESLLFLVRWHLRDYRGHPQWEDLLAEAYLGMWQAINEVGKNGKCKLTTAATRGAKWGALDFLRSSRNDHRKTKRIRGQTVPYLRPVSLSLGWGQGGFVRVEDEEDLTPDPCRTYVEPSILDFSDQVLERLEWEDRLNEIRLGLTEFQYTLFCRTVVGDDQLVVVAHELRVSHSKAGSARRKAVEKVRAILRKRV